MITRLRKVWIVAGLITAFVIATRALLPQSKEFPTGEPHASIPDSLASTLLAASAHWLAQTTCNFFTNN